LRKGWRRAAARGCRLLAAGRLTACKEGRRARHDGISKLLRLRGVWVRKVRFEPDRVIVEVALRRGLLCCPKCSYSTRARKDTRPEDSVWRHLDLGIWRLESTAGAGAGGARVHGARTESVLFARPVSEFTRDFECLVAWLATRTATSLPPSGWPAPLSPEGRPAGPSAKRLTARRRPLFRPRG
jgi:hypothetical protein